MIIFKEATLLQKHLDELKMRGQEIGFVPTMGALHEGHLSLISKCKKENDRTVCSIFVNPTQFNNALDFEKYPSTIPQDILQLSKGGCDVLFMPSVKEIYPTGTTTSNRYELGNLEKVFEGIFRPGHFQGVCQVVERLLKIVIPDRLYLGQKDYQQIKVIEKLIQLLKLKVQLVIAKTTREETGLAMSSRNMRLNGEQRNAASSIYKTLNYVNNHYKAISFEELENDATHLLMKAGFTKVDYVAIADAQTLEQLKLYDPSKKNVALIAAFLNDVRLIDNMLLED